MKIPTFDLNDGLNYLLPNPQYETIKEEIDEDGVITYRPVFIEHTEEEYDAIKWRDVRPKPSWIEVEQATLTCLRDKIRHNIDQRTQTAIVSEFRFSLFPDQKFTTPFNRQFAVQNLWLVRESGLVTFPYQLYVCTDEQSYPQYITLNSADELNKLYLEMFNHVSQWLESGRQEKAKLKNMTRTELEEYRDLR